MKRIYNSKNILKEVFNMSVKDVQAKKLEEEVVVNECETTELVEVNKEAKKAKAVKVAKKVGKIAAIAGVGFLGYLLGTKAGSKESSYFAINARRVS